MQNYLDKIEELEAEAYSLPNGASKVALLEEAVRLADAHGDPHLAFELRDELIHAATFGGFPEKSLVAFSWCLSQHDANPGEFDEFDLMWKHKWIIDSLGGFPQISRSQIEDMFKDMTERFERAGAGKRVAKKLECTLAFDMGERERAWELFLEWQKIPRDMLSDCPACEQDDLVAWNCSYGHDEASLKAAERILDGRMSCAEVPQRTYAKVLLPLFRLNRLEEAAAHHRKGYRQVESNAKFLRQQASHLEFVVLTDNVTRGCQIFERHIRSAGENANYQGRFEFVAASLFLMKQMQAAGRTTCALRLPKSAPVFRDDGNYETGDLIRWLDETANDIANRLDQRNGNDWYTQCIKRTDSLLDQVKPFELKNT